MVSFCFPQWLFKFCVFLITLGKGSWLFCIWLVCFGICVISACTNDFFYFLLFCFFLFFLLPSHFPCFTLLSLYFLLNFFAYCSSPCLFLLQRRPRLLRGLSHWACARAPHQLPCALRRRLAPTIMPLIRQIQTAVMPKRNSSPYCCNSSSRARGWANLHTLTNTPTTLAASHQSLSILLNLVVY